MESYYDLLRIQPDADRESIRRAFCRLAKEMHPDISKKSGDFVKILNAYKTLTDDYKRERYDSALEEGAKTVLPKERLFFAVSLRDVAARRLHTAPATGPRRRRRSFSRLKDHDVCINLTQRELDSGARIFIDAPAHVLCPLCRGSHTDCGLCSGRGHVLKAVPIPVDIPKSLSDEEVFSLPINRNRGGDFAYFMIRELSIKIKIFQG
jgi:DnaJ-class molecular chaperone